MKISVPELLHTVRVGETVNTDLVVTSTLKGLQGFIKMWEKDTTKRFALKGRQLTRLEDSPLMPVRREHNIKSFLDKHWCLYCHVQWYGNSNDSKYCETKVDEALRKAGIK